MTLYPTFRRQWPSAYAVIEDGRQDPAWLERYLVQHLPAYGLKYRSDDAYSMHPHFFFVKRKRQPMEESHPKKLLNQLPACRELRRNTIQPKHHSYPTAQAYVDRSKCDICFHNARYRPKRCPELVEGWAFSKMSPSQLAGCL